MMPPMIAAAVRARISGDAGQVATISCPGAQEYGATRAGGLCLAGNSIMHSSGPTAERSRMADEPVVLRASGRRTVQ
jgi:hypothetical protein